MIIRSQNGRKIIRTNLVDTISMNENSFKIYAYVGVNCYIIGEYNSYVDGMKVLDNLQDKLIKCDDSIVFKMP